MFTAGLFAFTVNYNPTQRLQFFVNLGEQYPERKDGRGPAIVNTGVAYMLTHGIQLDLSVRTGVAGKAPKHPFIGGDQPAVLAGGLAARPNFNQQFSNQ